MPIPPVSEIEEKMSAPTAEDKALVEKAYTFATDAHKDHKRFSGDPYIIHPIETAKGLAELGMSSTVSCKRPAATTFEDMPSSARPLAVSIGWIMYGSPEKRLWSLCASVAKV